MTEATKKTSKQDKVYICPNPDCNNTYDPFGGGGRVVAACSPECAKIARRNTGTTVVELDVAPQEPVKKPPAKTFREDPVNIALGQMRNFGLEVPDAKDLVIDGTVQRFGKKDNSWYVLHYFYLDDKVSFILCGCFGDWKKQLYEKFDYELPDLTDEQKHEFAKAQADIAKKSKQAKQLKQQEAADKAAAIWSKLPTQGGSEYLKTKKVKAFGVKFSRGAIVLPLNKVTGELVGLQFIYADGSKIFLSGTAKKGAFHTLGEIDPAGRVMVAEGYATAASLYQAMGHKIPAIVAFDAGNLEPVVLALRAAYPDLSILICADNDTKTAGNPGLAAARKAAAKVGAKVAYPREKAAQGDAAEVTA